MNEQRQNQSKMQGKIRQSKQNERLAKIYTVIALRVKMLDEEICLWFSKQFEQQTIRMVERDEASKLKMEWVKRMAKHDRPNVEI